MDTGDAFDANCPTRLVLDRIGDKWSVLVLLSLAKGSMRFTELRDRIGGVTPKVLTQTLRAMEYDGLLTRKVYAEVPPKVEYTLTDLGHSLHQPVAAVARWAESNIGRILSSREAADHAR
ncbi:MULTISPECIES: winged helix-turn-helix transcriptional regulator [Nonomuraea]|uniref:Winged helix-turn-helix transcriptional regulator n=1 Tax=Nonomuraea mangrovi TaxID=2316207 RepID=A0ABW4T1G4_9ACTN